MICIVFEAHSIIMQHIVCLSAFVCQVLAGCIHELSIEQLIMPIRSLQNELGEFEDEPETVTADVGM